MLGSPGKMVEWRFFSVFIIRLPTSQHSQLTNEILIYRNVRHIASEICGVRLSEDNDENSDLGNDNTIQLWASLFAKTTSLARPISNEKVSPSSLPSSDLKYYILSNLLDICVNHPNLDMRRTYIGRILKLSKGVQKRLMAMIELRVRRQSQTPKTATPSRGTPQTARSEVKSIMRTQKATNSGRRDSMQSRASDGGEESSLPQPSRHTSTPPRAASAQNQSAHKTSPNFSSPTPTRNHSVAFEDGSPTGYTPAPKRQILRASETGFLSPGTMDSPHAIRAVVLSLQQKNKELSHDLALAQRRELEFKTKMDALKQNHRKDMIRLESASMEREQDLRKELQDEYKQLENQMRGLQEEAMKGRKAQEQLSKARDELDVLGRQENELSEMAEKVRKYKEKVAELHDVKENLKREQDAHTRAVDEIVNLDNQVKALRPAKRQLEEYKTRAVEAEVKLVESQGYLRRLEQRVQRADETSDSLFKETVMQKEQMDELVRRIKNDTEANMESAGKGVGEGVSELNPQVHKELVRLRNENLQLRAFAAKRQSDAVEGLEAKLDDTGRLAEKYKDQYLHTKDALLTTQSELKKSQESEQSLKSEIQTVLRRLGEFQEKVNILVNEKDGLEEDLESMRKERDSLNNENMDLCDEIQSLQSKLKETFEMGTERLSQLQKVTEELGQSSKKLEVLQNRNFQLEESADAWKANATEMESQYETVERQLASAKSELEGARDDLERVQEDLEALNAQVKGLEENKDHLEEQLEEERQSSNKALEATKQILETKHKQELAEQSKNMNSLLEDERKATRLAREEAEKEFEKLREDKRVSEERLQQKLKCAQKDLDETIVQMREECRDEVEKATKQARKEGDTRVNEIVTKGKGMIAQTKANTEKEMQRLDGEINQLKSDVATKDKEYAELARNAQTREQELSLQLDKSILKLNEVSSDCDEAKERLRTLQRDFRRLQEENDLYRRQVGGRFGVDGKLQSQYDNLQKEYNALFEENKQLKLQNRHSSHDGLGTISEGGLLQAPYNGRGAQNRHSMPHVVREYEEAVSALNDEKRELLMKNAAAVADVEKAEKRAWEREEENEKLKAELTSLKLALQRAELSRDEESSRDTNFQSPTQTSFYSARDEEEDRAQERKMGSPPRSQVASPYLNNALTRTSPGIERAKRERAHQEQNLRNSLSTFRTWSDSPSKTNSNQSFSTSPPKPSPLRASPARRLSPAVSQLVNSYESPEKNATVLSPTQKHQQSSNISADPSFGQNLTLANSNQGGSGESRQGSHEASKLDASRELPAMSQSTAQNTSLGGQSDWNNRSFVENIMDDSRDLSNGERDGQPECKQS